MPGSADRRAALLAERERALVAIAALTRDVERVVTASESSNVDDEHDPEGSTIAFERAQLLALRDQAERRVVEVNAALDRLAAGRDERCLTCGRPIGADRLPPDPRPRSASTAPGRRAGDRAAGAARRPRRVRRGR
jgi:RNA polymerase-binding transcription factor DksA